MRQPDRSARALPPHAPADGDDGGGADLVEWRLVVAHARLVARSARRHWVVVAAVWLGVVAASIALLAVLPRSYEVAATLQAQRNQVMAALSNPGRAVPLMEADAPTRQAAETVLRHDNLVALIRQTDLLEEWPKRRAPLLRLKDAIFKRLLRAPTEEERIDGFVGLLEERLSVTTGDGTITFRIVFPDKVLAYQLVEAALQNFIEARYASEITGIGEAISLLEVRSAEARSSVEGSLRHLEDLRKQRGRAGRRAAGPALRLPSAEEAGAAGMLAQVRDKRLAVTELEELRRRRIIELETRLEEQRAVFSKTHPLVRDLEQSIEALRKETPQLQALRRDLVALEGEARRKGFLTDGDSDARRARRLAADVAALERFDVGVDEDPAVEYAQSLVRNEVARYTNLVDRIETARLELNTARAAFKYRYTVIRPAQIPRGPIKPRPLRVLAAALLAGAAVGVFAAALVDLRSGRIFEPWQVEHQLGLPVLGELDRT